ncbi:hypothetical protein ONE63_003193 [Megalurothrips usitatus]|uniref:DNA polymerase theta n=1 Tax=Megalurothrips usitatus TaxID=439358 RepID=A0AAV7XAI4_9NEOP|nr:hypothetical protein ONE63_003193 [Megalurothrips usitatus]
MFRWQVECKTLVSEIVCIKTILERRKKVIFVLPFVSVVREKMFYFKEIFRGSKVRVDGYMGGYFPPGGFQMLDLAICTIEKANSLVNRLMEENELTNLGAVVVDELHLIGDPHRGYLLELLLTKLKYMSLRNDLISVQLVGMSATLPNLSLLSSWLDADLYKTSFRPVPLEELIKVGNILYDSNLKPVRTIEPELEIKNDTEDIVYLCLETICNGHSVLIFCPTKAWCESLAQTIASELRTIGLGRDINAPDSMAFKLREQLNAARIGECLEQLRSSPVGLDNSLGKVISFGVAYHHAGLSLDERDIVEGSFKSGTIRVLVATTTLSSGVNLPARRVIIRSPVFQGRSIDILSYRQMVGRAGRMGVDSAGESILICQKTERRIVANLVGSSLKPIESCLGHGDLAASLKRAVLEVIASGVASTPEDLQVYTNCTLLSSSREEKEKDNNPLSSCITFLEHNELIRLQTGDDKILRYTPTPLGQACLSASIHPDEGLRLFKELQRARQCFVLENELHLVYQVTPFNVADQWGNLDWLQVLALWEQLTPDMKRVGELVGVEDRFLVRAMRGTVNLKLEKQCQKLTVHRRFYAALALHDLVNEVPLNTVAAKFNCTRGMLQSLQQSAATYAGMVTSFCHRLGWSSVELLVHQFQDRLHFGTHRELLDLLRLPSLNGPRARALYNAGITSVSELTSADVLAVENALYSAIPFLSDKGRDGETASEIERRKKLKGIWITGRQGLSEREAADLLIKEARSIIQEVLNTHTWSMSLACEHNEVAEPTVSIGSKILRTQKSSRQKSQPTSQLAFGDSILVGVSFCFGSTDAYFLSLESECQSCVVSLNERLQLLQKVLSRDEAEPIPTVCCFDVKEQWKMLYRCAQIQMHHLSFCDPKIGDWLLEPEGKEKTPSLDTSQTISGRQRCSVESILCFQIMKVEMPVLVCVSIMELTGIGFNAETLHRLQEQIREEMSSLESKAYQLAGRTFSLTSPTDTARRNTSKETLSKLRSEHPLPDVILLWRKLNAIHSKTVCPLLPSEPCSRLLGCYIMHTATGRISMHEPNIQCIPRDFEISPESPEPFCMRSAFVASEGELIVHHQ